MKKVIVGVLAGVTLLSAEIPQKGFFIGVDYTKTNTTLAYDKDGGGIATSDYSQNVKESYVGYRIGYQYYFTRFYFRYNGIDYKDMLRNKYTIEGSEYEINGEYIPTFYATPQKSWVIRGIFGAMVGYTRSQVNTSDAFLLPPNTTSKKQNNFLYGFQGGVMLQSDIGLNLEVGVRYKKGNLAEISDGTNTVVFTATNREYFVGLNYLF